MSEEQKYTERDLYIASELGALTKVVMNLDSKICDIIKDNSAAHDIMWSKIDKHHEQISSHSSFLKWIIGIGVGIQAAWGIFTGVFKH